ncbi:hypothetical protein [Streptomyces sp. NPDC002580]|uniref:hypothetical protein n=1 Tax=Streptomyces sp. NPDC002580 TaxID=3364653 RepID=UPI0036B7DFB3
MKGTPLAGRLRRVSGSDSRGGQFAPAATEVGDELAVACLPDQPAGAVVVAERGLTALVALLQILAGFCVFLTVMAGIAFIGVLIIQGYASEAVRPDSLIAP